MFWNLGGLNQQLAVKAGFAYIQFLATVMEQNNVALIGFSGIRSGLGRALSEGLVAELGNRVKSAMVWNSLGSPGLGAGRNEQYLFVWNMKVFTSCAFDGSTDYWRYEFPLPGGQQGNYGFPRPTSQSPDMPPFAMYFQLMGSTSRLPVTLFHAPDWTLGSTLGQGIAIACNNIAQIPTFDLGQGGLLMGTFNVPADDDVTVTGSNGAGVFGVLAGPNGKYTQLLANEPTQLSDTAAVAAAIIPLSGESMDEDDEDEVMDLAVVQPSENIFFRRNGTTNGLACTNTRVPELLNDNLGTLNDQDQRVRAPLAPALAYIELNVVGRENVTAGPDDSYYKLDDAFAVYRNFVSASLPIMTTLTF
jgi:hypothetical protein